MFAPAVKKEEAPDHVKHTLTAEGGELGVLVASACRRGPLGTGSTRDLSLFVSFPCCHVRGSVSGLEPVKWPVTSCSRNRGVLATRASVRLTEAQGLLPRENLMWTCLACRARGEPWEGDRCLTCQGFLSVGLSGPHS